MIRRGILSFCALLFILFSVVSESAAIELMGRPSIEGEPTEVSFFIFILDIDDINGAEQNFIANIAIRLQWKDERLAKDTKSIRMIPLKEVWNPRILLTNRQTLTRTSLPKVVEVDPDGTVNYRQRYVGPLSQPLRLSQFPFDRHDFRVQFVAVGFKSKDLKFIPGKLKEFGFVGGEISKNLSQPDWDIEKYSANSRPYEPIPGFKLAGFDFEFTAKRHIQYYVWQVLIPLVFIVTMSWGAFWIDPEHAGAQIGVATSSMLTLIAYRFMLGDLLPRLPYMTRMDFFTLAGTALVFLAFVEVVTTTILVYKKKGQLARKIDVCARVVFPVVYIGWSGWALFL
ncbi:MAG: hypothetical protein FVQ82_12435 [Planctomycetes bacterium]|nr:hypothetical protein [Planctomycetota bacterium]